MVEFQPSKLAVAGSTPVRCSSAPTRIGSHRIAKSPGFAGRFCVGDVGVPRPIVRVDTRPFVPARGAIAVSTAAPTATRAGTDSGAIVSCESAVAESRTCRAV